eukprot:COSAG01_NODE_1315_length_10757_cov_13.246669_8_plen_214_part_00
MGAFFGEVALVLSRPRTASVRAASTVSSATPSPAHGGSRILRTWGCSDPSVATRGAQTHIPEYIYYVGQCTTVRAAMWVGVAVHDMTAQVEVYRLSKLDFELTLRQHPRIRQQVRARSPALSGWRIGAVPLSCAIQAPLIDTCWAGCCATPSSGNCSLRSEPPPWIATATLPPSPPLHWCDASRIRCRSDPAGTQGGYAVALIHHYTAGYSES